MIAAWIAILTRQQTAPTVSWPCMAAASAILARKAIGLVPAPSAQGVADRGQATIVSGSAQLPSHGRDRSLALRHLPPMDGFRADTSCRRSGERRVGKKGRSP